MEAVLSEKDEAIKQATLQNDSDTNTNDDDGIFITILEKGKNALRYQICKLGDQTYIHIHRYYWGKEDFENKWLPGPKGICFRAESFEKMIPEFERMVKIAQESDLFEINLVRICIAVTLKVLIEKKIQNACKACKTGRGKKETHTCFLSSKLNWSLENVQKNLHTVPSGLQKARVVAVCENVLEIKNKEAIDVKKNYENEIKNEKGLINIICTKVENNLKASVRLMYKEIM